MNLSLNFTDYASIAPLLILLAGGLLLVFLEAFYEHAAKRASSFIAFIAIAAALLAACYSPASENPLLTSWLRNDALAHIFNALFLLIGFASTLLSIPFFQRFEASRGEYYFLLLSSLFGLILIGSAADFLTLFLGLETLSLSLYVLCGYMKKWEFSREAALKYFLLGAMAAAFLLYGIALIYGAVGTTRLDMLAEGYATLTKTPDKMLFLSGIALVTLGLAFKAAIVPFHIWAPDVYCGVPTPVTAFMAAGIKVGAFAAFARVFLVSLPQFDPLWSEEISLLAYPTLIYANIVALRQQQLRRFFAYSGISHAGFMLLPLAAGTPDALQALLFYLAIYSLATLGCFAVLSFIDQKSEGVMLDDLKGLFFRSPLLAGVFAFSLLTLGGIPPTAGFFAKLFIFQAAFQAGYYGLIIVGLLTSILSAFYYLRIVSLMFAELPEEKQALPASWPASAVGIASCAGLVLFSCLPNLLWTIL